MNLYRITTRVAYNRTYEVEAEDDQAAMAAYEANQAEWISDDGLDPDDIGPVTVTLIDDPDEAGTDDESDSWPADADMVKSQEE
jgi:hypothetical protein